jgi:hypothetical protein
MATLVATHWFSIFYFPATKVAATESYKEVFFCKNKKKKANENCLRLKVFKTCFFNKKQVIL